jgi:serine/threonine protein kinase
LWDWVQENKRNIGRRLWMKWAQQLSSAMERMHAIGLVHHDVKPHNIMLTEMLDIKMSDFGNAMFVNATSALEDGLGKGTLPYSPPELLATPPHPYSHPVDIFSLGVTLYVIGITGEEPFRMIRSPVELLVWVRKGGFWEWEERLRQFMTSTRTPPHSGDLVRFLNGEPVPIELLELLKRMVSPDPAERPTATEITAMLKEFDGGDDRFCGGLGWSGFDVEKRGDQSLFGAEDEGTEAPP